MKKHKTNPRRITDDIVLTGVKNKIARLENELRKNPSNVYTAQRLAELKKIHKGKIVKKGVRKDDKVLHGN